MSELWPKLEGVFVLEKAPALVREFVEQAGRIGCTTRVCESGLLAVLPAKGRMFSISHDGHTGTASYFLAGAEGETFDRKQQVAFLETLATATIKGLSETEMWGDAYSVAGASSSLDLGMASFDFSDRQPEDHSSLHDVAYGLNGRPYAIRHIDDEDGHSYQEVIPLAVSPMSQLIDTMKRLPGVQPTER